MIILLILIKQGIKFQLRDKNWIIFNIVFPIVLLLMTSYFMKNNFGTDNTSFDTIAVGVSSENPESSLLSAMKSIEQGTDIQLKEISSTAKGKELLQKGELQVLLVLKDKDVYVYGRDEDYAENIYVTSLVENVSSSLLVPKTDIHYQQSESEYTMNYIDVSFSSSDYYGVVIITMMILYVMIVPLCLFSYDYDNQIIQRICMTGFNQKQYFFARIISSFILELIIIVPIFLFTIFVLKTNLGNHFVILGLSILLTILLAVLIGTVLYKKLKSYEKCLLIVQTLIIPVWSFLGGSYIKLNTDNAIINTILWMSPLRWLNQGIFREVYVDDCSILIQYSLIVSGVIVLLGIVLIISDRRRKEK